MKSFLNQKKCVIGSRKIKFWGLIVSDKGISPDPEKVEALKYLTTPQNKEELISFLCMMQSNADFIRGFSEKASVLRELTRKGVKFKWEEKHESCFHELLNLKCCLLASNFIRNKFLFFYFVFCSFGFPNYKNLPYFQ